MTPIQNIAVIGAGAWGTALANVACMAGRKVTLWAREPGLAESLNQDHVNAPYLPGVPLSESLRATADLHAAVAGAQAVLLVVPAQFLGGVCADLAPYWPAGAPAVICAKGIEQGTGRLMEAVVGAPLAGIAPVLVLSGPTFAAEVARGLPTAVTLAGADGEITAALRDALMLPTFRIYQSDDVTGAEVAGAIKNVLAIACGIVTGKGLGDNARAALITRGLVEITRLGVALGARPETFMGLSGLGDLTLTCNAMQSRNFSLGVALGEGQSLADILAGRTAVTEGVYTAAAATDLARKLGVEMPICRAVDGVLNHHADLEATIRGLLSRPPGSE
ncbi:MAG: NAD(P)H-dependent glycerol-3-phosphate dehydrogenase [Magnetospiraceae bacterium]